MRLGAAVGIDRGVSAPLMLSDGQSYSLPETISLLDRRARKAQRVVARRRRGSRQHATALRAVRRIKAKQARARKHWAHCTTTDICRGHGTVVIERLRTGSEAPSSGAGMVLSSQ